MARQFTGEAADAAKSFTNAQGAYLVQRGSYDQAVAAANALWAEVPDDADDDVFTAAFERIEALVPVHIYGDALRVAEDVLIAQARRSLALDPRTARQFGRNAKDLDRLFSDYRRHPQIADKLIAATMRLDPYA